MSEAEDFPTFFASRLPQGNKVRVYHVSTHAEACPPLFAPGPERSEEATTLESHFFVVSQPQRPHQDVLVLGIEVLIFTTDNLTTVFVSKADSTGLLTRAIKDASRRTSLAQISITAFLDYLLKPRLDRGRLVLSLFARSQNQYLFPGSIENVTKHVLDDRQLIKWWCRLLDPLARQAINHASRSVTARVVVPGCDASETRAFFPSSVRSDSISKPMWLNVYPVNLLVEDTSLPVRCLVPRLPDDPKSRFLDDLDSHRDVNGDWRGIKTLDQFWEMMSYRQECSAGRLVGFVWLVFSSTRSSEESRTPVSDEVSKTQKDNEHELVGHEQHLTMSKVHTAASAPVSMHRPRSSVTCEPAKPPGSIDSEAGLHSTASASEIVTPATALTAPSTAVPQRLTENCHDKLNDLSIHYAAQSTDAAAMTSHPTPPKARLLLSAESYQNLMDELLQLDFAGEPLAIESTAKWRNKAMSLAGVSQFGTDVEGVMTRPEMISALPDVNANSAAAINILTGVRRKRKPSQDGFAVSGQTGERAAVNTLPTNLVRKKPKA